MCCLFSPCPITQDMLMIRLRAGYVGVGWAAHGGLSRFRRASRGRKEVGERGGRSFAARWSCKKSNTGCPLLPLDTGVSLAFTLRLSLSLLPSLSLSSLRGLRKNHSDFGVFSKAIRTGLRSSWYKVQTSHCCYFFSLFPPVCAFSMVFSFFFLFSFATKRRCPRGDERRHVC